MKRLVVGRNTSKATRVAAEGHDTALDKESQQRTRLVLPWAQVQGDVTELYKEARTDLWEMLSVGLKDVKRREDDSEQLMRAMDDWARAADGVLPRERRELSDVDANVDTPMPEPGAVRMDGASRRLSFGLDSSYIEECMDFMLQNSDLGHMDMSSSLENQAKKLESLKRLKKRGRLWEKAHHQLRHAGFILSKLPIPSPKPHDPVAAAAWSRRWCGARLPGFAARAAPRGVARAAPSGVARAASSGASHEEIGSNVAARSAGSRAIGAPSPRQPTWQPGAAIGEPGPPRRRPIGAPSGWSNRRELGDSRDLSDPRGASWGGGHN
jgi:hypothetical protein